MPRYRNIQWWIKIDIHTQRNSYFLLYHFSIIFLLYSDYSVMWVGFKACDCLKGSNQAVWLSSGWRKNSWSLSKPNPDTDSRCWNEFCFLILVTTTQFHQKPIEARYEKFSRKWKEQADISQDLFPAISHILSIYYTSIRLEGEGK